MSQRPVDTILPPLRSDAGQYTLRGEQVPARLVDPKPLDPDPHMAPSLRRARGMPKVDADSEVGQFVAELDDGTVEPIPVVGLDTWAGVGDACHQLIDLDGGAEADADVLDDDKL